MHKSTNPDGGTRLLHRRRFLEIAGLSALALCSGPRLLLARNPDLKKRAIIVGAGVAGLAANQQLQAAGFTTVMVEARQRIGGRVWTDRNGFDLGASWIHGVRGNPLMPLVRTTKAQTFPFDYENMLRYSSAGEIPDSVDQRIDADFASLESGIASARKSASPGAPLSEIIEQQLRQLSSQRAEGLRYAVNTNITHEYAADPGLLSLRFFDAGAPQAGGDLLLPGGYASLLAALGTPDEFLPGHIVHKIRVEKDHVAVETSAGEIQGDTVVVTLPLGVLKAGKVTFTPELPEAHRLAIARLGFGTLNKLFLRFPKVSWPSEPRLFGYVGDGWWEEWVNFVPVNGQPVLLGFNAGAVALESESLSEQQLVASAMRVLRTMFGRSLPDPVQAIATRWGSDPFAGGSYSCYATGSSPQDRIALAKPVSRRLIFAGEACSVRHPATVHGALSSGRSAARILSRAWKAG
jgi:monoamine oxidase